MSPRVDSEDRRTQIIEAAIRCLLRDGYNSTSMNAIVAESGLSTGTIYWHFENKKELFVSVFEYVINQAVGDFGEFFEVDMAASQKLHMILSSISHISEDNIATYSVPVKFMIELLHDEDILARYQQINTGMAEQIREIIEQGIQDGEFREVDPIETSWMLVASIEGLLLYHAFGMPGSTSKQSQIMADIVIAGLKN